MMKCLTLAVLACVIGYSMGMTNDERVNYITSLITKCGETEGAPSSDVDLILNNKLPQTQKGRCIGVCVGSTTGMIKDNKLDVKASVALANYIYEGNAERVKAAEEIAEACVDNTDNDRCEAAYKIFSCLRDQTEARGLTLVDI